MDDYTRKELRDLRYSIEVLACLLALQVGLLLYIWFKHFFDPVNDSALAIFAWAAVIQAVAWGTLFFGTYLGKGSLKPFPRGVKKGVSLTLVCALLFAGFTYYDTRSWELTGMMCLFVSICATSVFGPLSVLDERN